MHICIVTHVFPLNVISPEKIEGSFIVPLIKELHSQGHEVTVFTPSKHGEVIDDLSISIVRFKWFDIGKTLGNMNILNPIHLVSLASLYVRGCIGLKRLVKDRKVDHCISMWAIPSGSFTRYAKQKTGVLYSVWCLGTDIHSAAKSPLMRKFIRKNLRDASKLFADGISFAKDVEKLAQRYCQFIPTIRVSEDIMPSKVDLPEGKFNFLYIGRFEKVKGVDILIEAFYKLLKMTKDVHLTVIGEGSMEESLKQKSKMFGIGDFIDFKGYLPDEVRQGYLSACDCQVIPSRNESIPLVLTEAVKSGIRLIVTDVGDMGILAKKYSLGVVIQPEESDALSNAMLMVMNKMDFPVADRRAYQEQFDLTKAVKYMVFSISAENNQQVNNNLEP